MNLFQLKKYKTMILLNGFFFYLGCALTFSFYKIECLNIDKPLINMKNSIEATSVLNGSEYVVTILSSPDNREKREAIRATWANLIHNIEIENGEILYKWNRTLKNKIASHEYVKIYFVIGSQGLDSAINKNLKLENMRTRDLLLLENLTDNYESLSLKVLLTLKWVWSNMKNVKYLIKCDDDSFVRVDLIIKDLETYGLSMKGPELNNYVSLKEISKPVKALYWGYFDGRAHVYRTGKWREKDWFLSDKYVPHALGGGYVLSKMIIDYIGRNSDYLSLYTSEDVSMGVWTAALSDVNRVHDIRFDTEWKSRGCNNNMLVRHKQTPKDMFYMYKTLVATHGKKLCKKVSELRKAYKYNWNVLPSKCCT